VHPSLTPKAWVHQVRFRHEPAGIDPDAHVDIHRCDERERQQARSGRDLCQPLGREVGRNSRHTRVPGRAAPNGSARISIFPISLVMLDCNNCGLIPGTYR
jgi:hypothetical protein